MSELEVVSEEGLAVSSWDSGCTTPDIAVVICLDDLLETLDLTCEGRVDLGDFVTRVL